MLEILTIVDRVRRRLVIADSLKQLVLLGTISCAFFCTVVAVDRLVSLSLPLSTIAVGLGAVSLLGALTIAWPRRKSQLVTASIIDKRLRLKTRLSSAIPLAETEDAMAKAAVSDARAFASGLDPRHAFPLLPTGGWKALFAATILIPLSFLVPRLDLLEIERKAADRAEERERVVAVVEKLESQIRELTHKAKLKRIPRHEATLRNLAELAEELAKSRLDKRRSLERLEDLKEHIRNQREALAVASPHQDHPISSRKENDPAATTEANLSFDKEQLQETEELWKRQDLLAEAFDAAESATRQLARLEDFCKECLEKECGVCNEGEG